MIIPALLILSSCGDTDQVDVGGSTWSPERTETWQWQLEGDLDLSYDVDIYDIDLLDTSGETISAIQANGAHVVCYFSAGSWEQWRDDAAEVDPIAIGKTLDGWEDERWLDIGHPSVRDLMTKRLDLAVAKGCNGVEPDNVAGFADDTGFDFDRDEQISYNVWLADLAHERRLAVALKNATDLLPELIEHFDFAVNEQCWEYGECDDLQPFLDAGKAVFNAEYADRFVEDPSLICGPAAASGIQTLILPLELDGSFRVSCADNQR